jgi:hypothetical protein
MDTIFNVAFGLDMDLQNKPDNPYFHKCERHFQIAAEFPFIMHLLSNFFVQKIVY